MLYTVMRGRIIIMIIIIIIMKLCRLLYLYSCSASARFTLQGKQCLGRVKTAVGKLRYWLSKT